MTTCPNVTASEAVPAEAGHRCVGKHRDDRRGVDFTSVAIAIRINGRRFAALSPSAGHDCRRAIFLTASGVFLYASR
jgi:hypothetical protein